MKRLSLAVVIELLASCATRGAAPTEAAAAMDESIEATASHAAPTAGALDTPLAPAPSADAVAHASSAAISAPRASVRFLCDSKYVSSEPCIESTWMMEVVRTPSAGGLLAHDGPGPEGAIWNGDAPMVVIVPESVRSVSIGSSPLRGTKELGLGWFRVPPAVWRAALVQIGNRPYRVAPVLVDGKLAGEIWFAEGE